MARPFKGEDMSPCWTESDALSSQLSAYVRARGRRALSVFDSPVPDMLIKLHVTCWCTHTHKHTQKNQNKGESEGMKELNRREQPERGVEGKRNERRVHHCFLFGPD